MTAKQTPPGAIRRGSETASSLPPSLVVDGPRPAVEWVASLPTEWTTTRERLVLFALACDAYDSVSAPGGAALSAWSGLINGRLYEVLGKLATANDVRPALIQRVDRHGMPIPEGKRYGGRTRTGYRLLVETLPGNRDSKELSRQGGRVSPANSPANSPGKLSRETLPGNSPVQPGDSLPFPSLHHHLDQSGTDAREAVA